MGATHWVSQADWLKLNPFLRVLSKKKKKKKLEGDIYLNCFVAENFVLKGVFFFSSKMYSDQFVIISLNE